MNFIDGVNLIYSCIIFDYDNEHYSNRNIENLDKARCYM